MGEPGAAAGAPLTLLNTLASFAAHLAAEQQAWAKQRRSSLVHVCERPKICLNKLSVKAGGGHLSVGSEPVQSS